MLRWKVARVGSLGLLLGGLLLVSPGGAQDPRCTITRPSKHDTRVKCGDVEIGLRDNPDGTRDRLKKVRDPKKLWLGKSWKAERVRPEEFPPELEPDRSAPSELTPAPALTVPSGPVVHDLYVVATTRAVQAAGGLTAITAEATLDVALTAETLANSGVNVTPRLVGLEQVAYTESGIQTDLSRLRNSSDGYLDDAITRANAKGADDVVLLGEGYMEACGVAYLYGRFAVVERKCANGNLSFPHEYGHTLNLNHDPQTKCGQPVCPGYNFGSRSADNAAGTTMAYGGGRRRQFSNPAIPFLGRTDPSGITEQRDNARMARETAASVAARMPTKVADPEPPPLPPAEGPYVLDHLCQFTTAVKYAVGGTHQARNRCQISLDHANLALLRNGLYPNLRHRLLGTLEVTGAESVTWQAALAAAQTKGSDTRESLGADVGFQLQTAMTANGVATSNFTQGEFDTGTRVWMVSALKSDFLFGVLAHEVAHLGGVQHDRPHATGAALKPYGFGYANATHRDRMSYADGTTAPVNAYASPLLLAGGQPLGTATEDAARAFAEQFPFMAVWREPQVTPPAFVPLTGAVTGSAAPSSLSVGVVTGSAVAQ